MSWTDERVETLKKLWIDGLSASQIAKQLGGVTRNAVIGKVHRLGLAGRAVPSRPIKRPTRARSAEAGEQIAEAKLDAVKAAVSIEIQKEDVLLETHQAEKAVEPETKSVKAETVATKKPAEKPACSGHSHHNGRLLNVLELGQNMCKWPIGDPDDAEFGFCGATTEGDWPYCAEHGAIAYQPQLTRGKNSGQSVTKADTAEEAKIRKAL